MDITLFDDLTIRNNLLPLTYTRPVADLRVGTFTIAEKWQRLYQATTHWLTVPYLQELFTKSSIDYTTYVNGAVLPNPALYEAVNNLKDNEKLVQNDIILAYKGSQNSDNLTTVNFKKECIIIKTVTDIFTYNGYGIEQDFAWFNDNAIRADLANSVTCTQPDNVFVEEGAIVVQSSINPLTQKVIIRKGSEIMEGTYIRGAFALGESAQVKMASKIYGATTIGDACKVGGELNNVVMHSNSSKAHDGFLGNAVIGAWCNLGADTNNSNLKNNYEEVKLWNYPSQRFIKTGLQFCGLVMADHSKCGINTMFNTGTVVGVSSNIFGAGFVRNYVPDFSWGGPQGLTTYRFNDALATMQRVFERRSRVLSTQEIDVLQYIFDQTAPYRIA